MKNTKAIFLIILGSFIIATGFAFAENVSYGQLEAMSKQTPAVEQLPGAGSAPAAAVAAAPTAAPAAAATVATPPKPAAAAPAPEPTFKEKLNKYLKEHMACMAMTGIGAFAGFALLGGPIGLIIGAVFMYGLYYMGNEV